MATNDQSDPTYAVLCTMLAFDALVEANQSVEEEKNKSKNCLEVVLGAMGEY